MNTKHKTTNKKRKYYRPSVEQISVDHEISIFMLTPPPDPGGNLGADHFSINPFKLKNL